jgi:hypothetical protein
MSRTIPAKWPIRSRPRPSTSIRRKRHRPATRCSRSLPETPAYILGGHFVGGRIARDGEAYRIVP